MYSVAKAVAASVMIVAMLANAIAVAVDGGDLVNNGRPANRGRIQIQGDDLLARFGSNTPADLQWAWAGASPSKADGLLRLTALWSQLIRAEQRRRVTALQRATRFINAGPHLGGATRPQSFYGSAAETEAHRYRSTPRIDIEVITGTAFH